MGRHWRDQQGSKHAQLGLGGIAFQVHQDTMEGLQMGE